MKPNTTRTLAAIALAVATLGAAAVSHSAPLGRHADASERVDQRLARMAESLDLSDAQRGEIRAILEDAHQRRDLDREEIRARVDGVLTPSQRVERDRLHGERMERRLERLADRLDLSAEQETELRAVLDARRDNPDITRSEMRERVAAVLTPEQRARFESMRGRDERGPRGFVRGPGGF